MSNLTKLIFEKGETIMEILNYNDLDNTVTRITQSEEIENIREQFNVQKSQGKALPEVVLQTDSGPMLFKVQNPGKSSQWAKYARSGYEVIQVTLGESWFAPGHMRLGIILNGVYFPYRCNLISKLYEFTTKAEIDKFLSKFEESKSPVSSCSLF